jgi:hypothetical protein
LHNLLGRGWWKFVPAVHALPRVFVLVVASDESDESFYSFLSQRRTRDHMREKLPLASLSSIFYF